MNMRQLALVVFSALLFVQGCSQQEHSDLQQYMSEVRARPAGEIEPLPTFSPYKTFSYGAVALRSPFDAPVLLSSEHVARGKETVKPDEARKREHLENFSFSALTLVGTVTKNSVMWSLINDGEGGIHRVRIGNYMGRNHGKIVAITGARIELLEIVPDGKGSWVERPRALTLQEKG